MNLTNKTTLEKYENKNINNGTLLYRLYVPLIKKDKYRLFIFLHGAGSRGNDGLHLERNAEILNTIINHPTYGNDTIIIAPQVPLDDYWTTRDELLGLVVYNFKNTPLYPTTALFIDFINNELFKKFNLDKSRLHIGGMSMGAAGGLHFILNFPNMFASAFLICGKLDLDQLNSLKDIPLWLFHSKDDTTVNYLSYDKGYTKLLNLGADVKYTLYEDAGHASWVRAYKEPHLLDWLFKYHK